MLGILFRVEVNDPANAGSFVTVAQYDYDTHGRLLSETDAEGYTLTYTYDALDRMTQVLFPDGTTQVVDYAQDGQMLLSPTKVMERDGRVTRHRYNSLGQRAVTIDAKQQPTFFEWCLCGDIKKLTDAKGQVTTWRHDIQGRVTAKISPDGNITSYQFYPSSGQLKSVTLPNDQASGQPTYTLKYDVAGRVAKQDYSSPSTADVMIDSFDFLGRVKHMTDGLGTHSWFYHPFGQAGGGRLHVMDGPLQHDALRHTYTHFGRLLRTENVSEPVGSGSTVRQFVEHAYDLMGRSTSITTDIGLNSLAYVQNTSKVDSIIQKIGGTDTVRSSFGYYPSTDPVHRGRLQNIAHAFPVAGGGWTTQVQHDYSYDVAGRITSWRWRSPAFDSYSAVDRRWEAAHDPIDQLESVVSYSGTTSTVLERWSYAYDSAGNRSYEEHDGVGTIATYAGANRLQKHGGAGAVHVSGTVDKAASVTVNGQPARVTSTAGAAPYRFEKDVSVSTGTQTFTIEAKDGAVPQQTTRQSYSIEVPAQSQTYAHDDNGNLLTVRDGTTTALVRGYDWDAANQLVKITYADGGSTEFQYDGLGQRRVITEKNAIGMVTSVTRLLWKGGRVWQEQDISARVIKRHHFNGVQVLSYIKEESLPTSVVSGLTLDDHLGSRREVVTLEGVAPTVTGRRDYDAYGKESNEGNGSGGSGYTQHYLHGRSGLALALYRIYEPETGRWLNEDPLGEKGGVNLYGYVENSPVMELDKLGLEKASKLVSSWLNAANAGRLLGSGMVKFGLGAGCSVTGGGALPGITTMASGAWNVNSSHTAYKKAVQQNYEANHVDEPGWRWRNLLGVLPWGTEYDDPHEPSGWSVCKDKVKNAWENRWEFFKEIGTLSF